MHDFLAHCHIDVIDRRGTTILRFSALHESQVIRMPAPGFRFRVLLR